MDRPVEPKAEEKRQALEAALNSETLARSGRLKNLLRFIAEAEIEGRGPQLNEYVIGVEALARPEGYSTSEDSSVRSRAHELRQKLERFYSTEAPGAPVRIELPKGSHCPRFVRNGVSVLPPPAQARSNGPLFVAAGVGLAAGVLATWLALTVRPNSGIDTAQWTPALETIWQPFLDGKTPILVSYEARLFLAAGAYVVVRDFNANEMNQIASSDALTKIKKALDLPQLFENRNYTEFGFIQAGILLTRLLSTRKPNISAKRSAGLTWSDIRGNNLIFLGKPATDAQIQHFLPQSEFVDQKTFIQVVHPKAGEASEYVEKFDPTNPSNWSEKYAIISFGPGPERGKSILCLAASGAEHPWAVATYLTTPSYASELVRHVRLPSGRMPTAYQVIVRARFRAQEPTQIEYVTHRVLQAN
jgi:hypothetical protein